MHVSLSCGTAHRSFCRMCNLSLTPICVSESISCKCYHIALTVRGLSESSTLISPDASVLIPSRVCAIFCHIRAYCFCLVRCHIFRRLHEESFCLECARPFSTKYSLDCRLRTCNAGLQVCAPISLIVCEPLSRSFHRPCIFHICK